MGGEAVSTTELDFVGDSCDVPLAVVVKVGLDDDVAVSVGAD